MFKSMLLLIVSVCAVDARSSAQVQVGVNLGNVAVRASVGLRGHHRAPSRAYRSATAPRARPRPGYRDRRGFRGHYQMVVERVWVTGSYEDVWVPARSEWRCDAYGNRYRVVVRAGYYRTVHRPGYWKKVRRRVWVAY